MRAISSSCATAARCSLRWCCRSRWSSGMGIVFGGPERPLFKVGVLSTHLAAGAAIPSCTSATSSSCRSPIGRTRSARSGRHQLDLLLDPRDGGALLGQHRFAEGLYRRETAAVGGSGAHAREPVTGTADPLRRLALSRRARHEHDVQLPLRRGLRRAALSQERLSQTPARNPAHRRSSS